MATIKDTWPDVELEKCGKEGCNVKLEKSFSIYCGEKLMDRIMEKNKSVRKMFDCVIADSGESKISAVALKNIKTKRGRPLAGGVGAGSIDHVRAQFSDGLIVLRRVLERIGKPRARIQLVLYAGTRITNISELNLLHQPLDKVTPRLTIIDIKCGSELPDKYVPVSVKNLRQNR